MPLSDYLAVLRRRGWVIPVVALVAAVSAFGFARAQTPLYRSSLRLEVSGRFDYGAQLTVEKQLGPLAQRLLTTEVAAEVDRRLRLDLGPETLLARVRAAPLADNAQIEIQADDTDADRVESVVREFARVYEEQHAAREQGKPVAERTVVTALDRPTPASQIWPQTRTLLLAAALIGALLGVALAFALDFLDDTFWTAEDVERILGVGVIGQVPAVSPDGQLVRQRGLARLVAARRAR
jgi:capsular polysaccharide biosynthesis protein